MKKNSRKNAVEESRQHKKTYLWLTVAHNSKRITLPTPIVKSKGKHWKWNTHEGKCRKSTSMKQLRQLNSGLVDDTCSCWLALAIYVVQLLAHKHITRRIVKEWGTPTDNQVLSTREKSQPSTNYPWLSTGNECNQMISKQDQIPNPPRKRW